MLKDHKGDIFKSPANVIIHQCNCFHKMGSGIAKQIADMFPEAVVADNSTPKDTSKLGSFSWAYSPSENKVIINLYGQGRYDRDSRQTRYDALVDGFEEVHKFIKNDLLDDLRQLVEDEDEDYEDDDSTSTTSPISKIIVGIPFNIGCGLGGGNWNIVKTIIDEEFEKSPLEILICKDPRFVKTADGSGDVQDQILL